MANTEKNRNIARVTPTAVMINQPKIVRYIAFLGFLLVVLNTNSFAQKDRSTSVPLDSCESAWAKLAIIIQHLQQSTDTESTLIVIVGSPTGQNRKYDRQRLNYAIQYISNHSKTNDKSIVWGLGADSKGYGYLKFYIQGKLVEEVRTHPKGNFCTEP